MVQSAKQKLHPFLKLNFMGEFRFRIPEYWEFATKHARTVHVVGIDGTPRPCNVTRDGNILLIRRNQHESGKTYISYPFSRHGELTICTGTLPESNDIYHLAPELARGTINRLRNQTSIWEEGGLQIPEQVQQLTRMAISKLGNSIVANPPEKDELAREALELSMQAIFRLSQQFGNDISAFRVSQPEIPSFWMATSTPNTNQHEQRLEQVFDLFAAAPEELAKSTAHEQSTKRIIGPILDASPMSSFSNDFPDFQAGRQHVLKQCDALKNTLDEHVALIHAGCGLNGIGHKNLNYRQQVQLMTEILNKLEDSNRDVPVMLSFDYPWAERLAWSVGGIHPIQIAEELMRNGSRISFIGLDVNLDYWPNGSVSRDPLQWIDMIDIWCQIGLPLVLCIRIPQTIQIEESIDNSDFQTNHDENVTIAIDAEDADHDDEPEPIVVGNTIRDNLDERQRLRLLQTVLPMVVARPSVHGIFWRQWQDQDDQRFPNAGLFNESGTAKPLTEFIFESKSRLLKR